LTYEPNPESGSAIRRKTRRRYSAEGKILNLDGYSDFALGFPFYDTEKGGAALFFGAVDGFPSQVWTVYGEHTGDGFGYSMAGIGDFTGDGFADVIVGAPYYDQAPNGGVGRFYGYMGNQRRFDRPGTFLQQMHVNGSAPISVGGKSDYQNAFGLRAEASPPPAALKACLPHSPTR
jgi:hypothetical protein